MKTIIKTYPPVWLSPKPLAHFCSTQTYPPKKRYKQSPHIVGSHSCFPLGLREADVTCDDRDCLFTAVGTPELRPNSAAAFGRVTGHSNRCAPSLAVCREEWECTSCRDAMVRVSVIRNNVAWIVAQGDEGTSCNGILIMCYGSCPMICRQVSHEYLHGKESWKYLTF